MTEPKKSPNYKSANNAVPYYVSGAVTAAVIPIPVADAVAITGVQLTMGTHIAHGIYKADIGTSTLKVLIGSFAASNVGLWAWSLVKTIPGIGTAGGIAGQMLIAGTVTAALGYGLVELLENKTPITKENLKKAVKKNKKRAKKTAEEAVNKNKDSIEILQKVAFSQDKDLAKDKIEFSFNLDELSNPKLISKHISTSEEKVFPLNNNQTSIEIDLNGWENGQYEVKMVADNIPDIMRYFVKE